MAGILSGLTGKGTHSSPSSGYDPLKTIVPLREGNTPDERDQDRIETYLRDYNRQTDTLLVADRQIEYNIRMLCNQQWNFYNWEAGQYMDISEWFTPEEQRWRQLPTVNDELRWFQNVHARITENPPILTFLPGPDKIDADLAEVLDGLVKFDYRRAGMPTLWPEIAMWMLVAGRGHLVTQLDLTRGDWRPWVGSDRIPLWDGRTTDEAGVPQPLLGPDNQPILSEQPADDVPFGPDGVPRAVLAPNGEVVVTGKGHMERAGGIGAFVPSPLQVRGEWGPQPWHQKRWHSIMRFMTPEQCYQQWGVELEPDVNAEGQANVAILERVLMGAGFYGTARGLTGGSGYPGADVKGPLCTVIERWDAPLGFDPRLLGTWAEPMMETPDTPGDLATGQPPERGNPGGRHIVFTPKKVIMDGPREMRWRYTSPVRCWDCIRLPGRPRGVTPLEILHSSQRSKNKMTQLIQEGVSLNAAPQRVLWEGFGIELDQVDNAPNKVYTASGEPPASGVPPIQFLAPPPMNPDLWRLRGLVDADFERLGGMAGTEGEPPTLDPSGEAIKEIRFNADRDWGDTARRSAEEFGRLGEDYLAVYPLIYQVPAVIAITGDESASKTITVWPELFLEGNVHVQADAESMLPEGRGERQARAIWLWKNGAFGNLADPQQFGRATDVMLELSRFPNYSKMARPGGVDRETAEIENGQFVMGVPGQPVLPWYDDEIHLEYHYRLMKSRDYLKYPQPVRDAMEFHVRAHEMQLAQKRAAAAMAMAAEQGGPGAAPGGRGGGNRPPTKDEKPNTSESAAGNGPAVPPASRGSAAGREPLTTSRPAS